MVTFPHAKINLGLHILSKRSDGYHNLDTCFYPISFCDMLEIIPAAEMKFSSSGLAISGSDDQNLCLKAYYLIKKDFNLPPVAIHLHKIIPMGAGLGGGSADGAFALKMLNEIFQLKISHDRLTHYASLLGSDCAFFLNEKPMIGQGKGDILEPLTLDLKGLHLILIKPPVHVSTAEAYAGVSPASGRESISKIVTHPVSEWRDLLVNDFERSVFKKYPVIGEVKKKLYEQGALYASMSGSGSSVFGLFSSPAPLRKEFVDCSCWEIAL